MKNQTFNIAEAKTHLSRLIERVECGERITIVRDNRPVAVLSPPGVSPAEVLSRIDAVRESVRKRNGGPILGRRETWRDLVDKRRRI